MVGIEDVSAELNAIIAIFFFDGAAGMGNDFERIVGFLSDAQPRRWVFGGDSITHGALHTFGWRDYCELFSERLRYEMGRGRDCVIKTAISGWRITHIADDLDWSILQHRPDVVSLNLGMNDCQDGPGGLDKFNSAYRQVLETIRRQTSAAVILHTPQCILPGETVRYANLPAYVEAVRNLAKSFNAVLIDHDACWAEAQQRGVINYWLSDAIHPNEIGHRAMARLLLQQLNIWDAGSFIGRLFIA